ncbi:uncharacterized protein GGS22DRAFT_149949 [Annulohypoxylon maeteangense]|uniref:uncharacterized protein n=1 Tax=Annulohypoxylon maeteangense TaxID=1927788 RepID=UPI0020078222|nr:uncharacterized protein GGS22DRAFT_149949 [Annulohypoxylon maeteangense]KAI0890079.1 hypothetical protein GGS22DRAFT_149949 [Annulohypoxylon maeteangense]
MNACMYVLGVCKKACRFFICLFACSLFPLAYTAPRYYYYHYYYNNAANYLVPQIHIRRYGISHPTQWDRSFCREVPQTWELKKGKKREKTISVARRSYNSSSFCCDSVLRPPCA